MTRALDRRSCLRLEVVVLGAVLVMALDAVARNTRNAIVAAPAREVRRRARRLLSA